jgi:GTPase
MARELIDVRPPIDRAVLIGAPRKGSREVAQLEEHLDELARLVDTAGADVVGRLSQQVATPNPATLIGEGKVEELRDALARTGATLAIFDEELSPVQGATLEKELKVRVMDRAEVILDIFSTRARTAEAKLQVELAQLQYLLPRLARMWTHLSRIRGGIGLRGPGETQLETDRRMIRRKIQHHRDRLKDVERHRETVRSGRQAMLSAALVGYTNAGKSSVLRALTGERDIFVEDRLFATLDTLTREVDLGEGLKARITDTVGFIRKLPHHLVASFRATLEEARSADLLLHVVDASRPDWEGQADVVEQVLGELELRDLPVVMVFNKMDQVADPEAFGDRAKELHPDAVLASARSCRGEWTRW